MVHGEVDGYTRIPVYLMCNESIPLIINSSFFFLFLFFFCFVLFFFFATFAFFKPKTIISTTI